MKTLFVTLVFLISSAAWAEVTIVTLESPRGLKSTLRSDDADLVNTSPPLKDLKTSSRSRLCRKSRAHHLERHLELDFIIENLIGKNKLGKFHKREVAKTPNCKPFRFKLHVLSKVHEGYTIKKIITKDIVNELDTEPRQVRKKRRKSKANASEGFSLWN